RPSDSRRHWLSSGSGNDQDHASRLDPDRCCHHAVYLGASLSADRIRLELEDSARTLEELGRSTVAVGYTGRRIGKIRTWEASYGLHHGYREPAQMRLRSVPVSDPIHTGVLQ